MAGKATLAASKPFHFTEGMDGWNRNSVPRRNGAVGGKRASREPRSPLRRSNPPNPSNGNLQPSTSNQAEARHRETFAAVGSARVNHASNRARERAPVRSTPGERPQPTFAMGLVLEARDDFAQLAFGADPNVREGLHHLA